MPTVDEVADKFKRVMGNFEKKPQRVFCLIGDGKGTAFVSGQTDYVYLRLDDGTYYGVAFIDLNRVLSQYQEAATGLYDLPVVAGYSHEQPTLFQVLEVRRNVTGTGAVNALGPLANVTGLAAVWQQDDVLLTWALSATSRLHNYLVTIDGIEYRPTSASLLYTGLMNRSDHSGAFDGSLSISVVAVDVYGNISPTPATLTATWTRPTVPNLSGGVVTWSGNDCILTWSDPVRPYTFANFLVTIGVLTFVVMSPTFTYTEAQNRAANGGVVNYTVSASIVASDRDGYTSFIPLVVSGRHARPQGDTVQDNFDTYGGSEVAQNGSAALHWLALSHFESVADSTLFDATYDTAAAVDGSKGIAIGSPSGEANVTKVADFTAEGRFGNDDFLIVAVYASTTPPAGSFQMYIQDTGLRAAEIFPTIVSGWNFVQVKRSDLNVPVGFDWAHIELFQVLFDGLSSGTFYIDDLRIVKADPDDATTFNDTGAVWDFDGGVWHIYQDVPDVAYALGQIDVRAPGTRYVARRTIPAYGATNHFAAGIYLRADGAAGLLAMAADADNGYEVKLDSSTDTLTLLKWEAGVSTTLGSVAFTAAPNTRYTLGLMRDLGTDNLRVFASDDATPIFTDTNLRLFVADSTYVSGQIGVVSYGLNSRFCQVRAGSPEHALTAEYAFESDTLDTLHARDFQQVAQPVTSLLTVTAADLTLSVHHRVVVTATGKTISLPSAVAVAGREYVIKASSGVTVTIDPAGSETIDGAATLTLTSNQSASIFSDGANWQRG